MERKRENPKLIPYIEQFLIEKLENCDVFVKTYGTGFIKQRLYENFKRLYTEETNPRYAGEYSLGDSGVMTLYAKGTDGHMLSAEDIEEDVDLQATVLHEGIHAIFNKTPEECAVLGIKMGSGLHFIFNGASGEIGRGLNEGFTNWLCEKAGLKPKSYERLTRIVKLLEQAIGEDKVIHFGKGNIEDNLTKLLQLPRVECCLLLAKTDTIYNLEEISRDYSEVLVSLKDKLEYKDKSTEEIPTYIKDSIQKLGSNNLYKKIGKNTQYLDFANEQGLDPKSDETKKEFFEKMIKKNNDRIHELTGEIHTTMISTYFSKELNKVLKNDGCDIEKYKKFYKISILLGEHADYTNEIIQNFNSRYDQLRSNVCNAAIEDIKKSLLNGTLTTEKIETYQKFFREGDYRDSISFIETTSNIMLPDNPSAYHTLLHNLTDKNQLPKLFDYKIIKLSSENGTSKMLFLDSKGESTFVRPYGSKKTMKANDDIPENDRIFDITLGNLQEVQEIVKNFISLKEEIKRKSPNTQIDIIDDVIITTDEQGQVQFYMLDNNKIVPAQARELVPQNERPKEQISFDNIKKHTVNPEALTIADTDNVELTESEAPQVLEESNTKQTELLPVKTNPIKGFFKNIIEKFSKFKDSFFNNKTNKESKPIGETSVPKTISTNFNDRIHVNVSGKYEAQQPSQTTTSHISKDNEYTK